MWNKFYTAHEAGFFKDRNWFRLEFPELFTRPAYLRDDEEFRVLEVGCGAGNTVFPVMKHHEGDGRTRMFAFDYSHVAVDLVKVGERWKCVCACVCVFCLCSCSGSFARALSILLMHTCRTTRITMHHGARPLSTTSPHRNHLPKSHQTPWTSSSWFLSSAPSTPSTSPRPSANFTDSFDQAATCSFATMDGMTSRNCDSNPVAC